MRTALDKQLRSQLEAAVEKARDVAELAAKEELDRLGVGEKQAPDYLSQDQRDRRNRLRAHGRFLGDIRRASGEQEVTLLVTEIAYEHWHRMLFSRFLAENDLLMYEDGVTALAISDCFDLAEEEAGDSSKGWQYAANYASKMLPQIFRNDSPVLELEFSPNHQKKLEKLLEGLDEDTFQAQDSLGWVYQYWQSKRKDEVNKSEVKIGAKELSPVTQLFTEPYMVSFLLDNALGAWWANQQLNEQDYVNANSEQELRDKAAIDGVPLEYLRFVRTFTPEQQALIDNAEDEGQSIEKPEPSGPWEPAAGKFEQWPENLSELKTLDPCCGSGHFLVSVFLMLVPIRMQREGLSEQQAIDAVLGENIHGLELDQRCVEIAVFALALEAWRYSDSGGYRQLPELHLACSGLSVKASKEEWKQLGSGKKNLTIALDWMHKEFNDAPVLGSLIDPRRSNASKIVDWEELEIAISGALSIDRASEIEEGAGIVAQGLAKTAVLLTDKYHWVVTNVPYLALRKMTDILSGYVTERYPSTKQNLACVFIERCEEFLIPGGTASYVCPQDWIFLDIYKKFRERFLSAQKINVIAKLGVKSFTTPMWDMNIMLFSHQNSLSSDDTFVGVDLSKFISAEEKEKNIDSELVVTISQSAQLKNPDGRIVFEDLGEVDSLGTYADALMGVSTGDGVRFHCAWWEIPFNSGDWEFIQGTVSNSVPYGGRTEAIFWQKEKGEIAALADSVKHLNHSAQNWQRGRSSWNKVGVTISQMGDLPATIYTGDIYDCNCCAIIPYDPDDIAPLWLYSVSTEFSNNVRKINQALKVPPKTLLKIPFDRDKWIAEVDRKFPNGMPKPFSNEMQEWVFHGHPCGSVIWDEEVKKTSKADFRTDKTVLQVSIARLLGYRWPAELDSEIELADEQREWVEESKKLFSFADDDGIVCLPAVRGEKPADQRLEELLQAAYDDSWSTQIRNQLLETVGCKNKSLEFWLREKFFEQHCKMFGNRPFIWHIWDGLKDGFSALVNYHQLDKKNLERLIYTYLDDWIRTQSHQQSEGVDGAIERLVAAQNLKQQLEKILEGEAPYDIFVRWKSLAEQPFGWSPDLNDGVRLNIRPFMTAGVLRHNKKPKLNIHWNKDRGKDVESAPWYNLGLEYDGKEGDRINDHHLLLAEKQNAKA